MGISFAPQVAPKKRNGNTRPLPVDHIDFSKPDMRLRVGHVLTLLSVSAPTFHKRRADGLFPKPDGYDGKRPYWRAATISTYLAGGAK